MYYHYLGRIPYRRSLTLQEDLVQKVKNMREFDSNTPDILLLLEHPLTYTEGRRTKLLNESLKQKLTEMGSDYVKVYTLQNALFYLFTNLFCS
jgi:lipoyl(octanoyl) transferase